MVCKFCPQRKLDDGSERRATFNHIGDINEMVNMANSPPLKTNNMKLYTEEQVRKMLLQDNIFDIDDILDSEMPIELPTDEEIEDKADALYLLESNIQVFTKGAKWVINKILNK